MKKIEELENLLASLKEEGSKFYEKENKAAGTRARKLALEIKNKAHDIRLDISNVKNKL